MDHKSKHQQTPQFIPMISKLLMFIIFTCMLTLIVWNKSLFLEQRAKFISPASQIGWDRNCNGTHVMYPKNEPILTAENLGRLGNQMFMYATLYAISKEQNRSAYMPPVMWYYISKYFNASLCLLHPAIYHKVNWTDIKIYSDISMENEALQSLPPTNVRFTGYPISWKYFETYHSEILREFEFGEEIKTMVRKKMDEILASAKATDGIGIKLIGVHVRRQDYIDYSRNAGLDLPTMEFYDGAMNYFKNKYKHNRVVFLVVSDDVPWCISEFRSFFAEDDEERYIIKFLNGTSIEDPGFDLAVLAGCDNVIYGVGTFGFWGAYLGGGEAVFCSDCISKQTRWSNTTGGYENLVLPFWKGFNRKGERTVELPNFNF